MVAPLVPLRTLLGLTTMTPSLTMLPKRFEPGTLVKSIGDLLTDMF